MIGMHEEFNPSYITPRDDIMSLIPGGVERLLDVGCSTGALGEALKERRNVHVTGVEFDAAMAAEAEGRLDDVCVADLNRDDLRELLAGSRFDCLIFADILEHLADPWRVLRQAGELLEPGGYAVTSLPNIRHISTFYSLGIKGRWPYRDRGIHDRTHLRHFARANIIEMLEDAGLYVVEERRNMRFFERIHTFNRKARYLDFPPLRPFFTFQYLHLSVRGRNTGR